MKTRGQPLQGIVEHFNYSPKGAFESVLLRLNDGVVQVNFAPGQPPAGISNRPGDAVSLLAIPELQDDKRTPEHPVFTWVDAGPQSEEPAGMVEGVVARINFARHGEPNGAVLESGDFVHLKPHGAKVVKLAKGQRLVVEGESRPTVDGRRAFEARRVNGVDLAKAEGRHKKPPASKH